MKILYLDVCALCRPFDEQNQLRIRLETDAVFLILRRIEMGIYRAVVSPVHHSEIGAIKETTERLELESLLTRLDSSRECDLNKARHRAEGLFHMGFGIADAAHVAFAEQLAEIFITCDDKLLRTCFKSVASGSSARRTERRNRNVLDVHEDLEHRATQQSGRVAAFKTRSKKVRTNRAVYRCDKSLEFIAKEYP